MYIDYSNESKHQMILKIAVATGISATGSSSGTPTAATTPGTTA